MFLHQPSSSCLQQSSFHAIALILVVLMGTWWSLPDWEYHLDTALNHSLHAATSSSQVKSQTADSHNSSISDPCLFLSNGDTGKASCASSSRYDALSVFSPTLFKSSPVVLLATLLLHQRPEKPRAPPLSIS